MTTDNLPEPTAGDDDVSAELIAASLRADTADLEIYARVLSSNLIQTLPPGAVRLERKRSLSDRAAGREGRVETVDVTLGEQRMTLRLGKHGPVGEVCKEVRGIVLSRQQVAMDIWIETLSAAIAETARSNARAREVLQRFVLGE
ncbi:hypothetical protein KGQ20_34000 [Catenulispora sp. NF23]|uniref:hypothetical protein n=1 Tax=Catenulispora pinistramenti TaxID=2705254 RepID=UPI001BA8C16F|nr:hypothetical protein [Catenulispora pinistramenti]MBS2537779.1 hypothetical protein [Catenulispora pinistramenti]